MSDLTWSNFAVRGEAVEVEEFLWGADIGSVIFEMDPGPIKNSLFSCLSKFEKYPGIQNRSLQLLQDCHILTPTGITNDELITKFDVLLRTLSSWCDNVEVVLNLFQLLAMIADRDVVRLRCCQVEETEMLQYLERAMRIHTNSKPVQRSGLQLFEEILRHAKSDRATYQILKKVFQIVLENLMLNINDPAICHSSFSILFSLADQQVELLLPWIDHLINLTMTTIANLHSSEVVFKCLLLLDKLADDDNNLISIAAHERGLMALCDAMGILAAKHLEGAVIALQITFRALEDVQVTSILLSQPESKNEFLNLLTTEITMKFEKFLALTTEYGLGPPKLSDALLEELFLKYHQVVDVIAELLSVTSADCSEAVVAQVEVRPTPPKPSGVAGETEAQIIAVPVLTKAEEKAAERRNGRLAKAQLANAAYADVDDASLKKQAVDSVPATRASTGTASAKGKKYLYIDTGTTPENKKAKGRGLRSSHYYSSSDEDISAEETEENTEEVPMSPEVDEYMRYLQAQTGNETDNTGNENQTDVNTEHMEEKVRDDLERLSSVHSMTDDLRYSNDNTLENNASDNVLLRTTNDHLLSSLSKSNDSEIFNLEKSAAGNDAGESRPDAVYALNSHSWEAVDVAVASNAKRDIVAEMRAGLVIEEQHEKAEDGPTELTVNIPSDSNDSSPQKRGTSPTPLTPKKSGNNLIARKKSDQNMGKLGSRSGSSENLNQMSPSKRTPGAWSPVKEKVLTAKERIALRMSEKNKPKAVDSDSEVTSNAAADALSAEAEAARETAARAERVRQFAQQADKERQIAAEKEREAQEERDRVAAAELQEKERKMAAAREEMDQQIAAVNAEKERLAAQQAELERQAAVQAEKERLLAVQMEEARLAADAHAEADRLAAIQAEEERQTLLQAERSRLAAIAEAESQRQFAAEEAAKRERQAVMDAEVARQAAIHVEIERQIAIAQAAEEERQAAAQAEVDRLAAVKAEQERQIAAAQAELSRLAAIQAEKEHQIALAEAERERLAAVQAEADRQAAVQAEHERQVAFAQAERDRQAAVAAEALRLAAVQAEKEREIAAAQAAELERQAAAQAELDRLTAIQAEKERQIAAAQAEMDRITAEQARREREAAAQAENDRQMAAIQAEEERQMAEAQAERERQQAVEAEVNRLAEKDRQAALQAERERQMIAVQVERDRQMVAAHAEKERKLTAQAELDRIAAVQSERDHQAVIQAEKDRQIATAQAEIHRQAVAFTELSRQMAVAQAEKERLAAVQTEKDIQSAAIQAEKDRQIAAAVAERERQAAAQAEIDRLASVQAEKDRQSAARLLAAAQSEKEQQILTAQAEAQRQAAVVADLQRQLSAAKLVPLPPPPLPSTVNINKQGERGASEERKESSELSVDVQFVKEHAGDIARSVTDTELVEMVSSLERSQQQTASALLKSDAMHKLFMDAAKKIEDMVLENDQLWSRVREAEEAQYRITVASNENEDEEEGDEEQYDHNGDHTDDHSQQDSPHSSDGQHGAAHDAVQFDQIYRVSSTESKESVHGTGLSSVHSVHGSSSKKGSNPMMNLNSAFASPNPKTNSRHVTYSSSAAHHRQNSDHTDNVLSAHLTSPQLKAKIKYRRLRLRKTHTIYGGARPSSTLSHNDQYHHSSSPAVENCRQSLAVAGILEALDQISLSEKPSSGNALATGDGTTSEESVFSADNFPFVHHLAAQLSLLFKHSKENTCEYVLHMKDAVQRSSSIPIKALKVLIRRLNLIDNVRLKHHDVDLILSTLQVKTVSVFGVAYCVILCAQRRFKSHSGVRLVQQLSGLVTAATQQIEREIEEYNSRNPLDEDISESAAQYRSPDHSAYHTAGEDDQSVYTQHSTAGNTVTTAHTTNSVTGSSGSKPYNNLFQMSSAEFRDVLKLLEAEKRAFITIYEAYAIRINPNSSSSSNVSSGGSGRFSTSSHGHHGNSSHTPSSSSKATIKLSDNSYTLGLSFLNIVQFAFDFQISPELINRAQLAKIFNKLVDSSSSGGGGGSVHSIHSSSGSGEDSTTITFLQFLDLIVLIATRCPIFRGANSPLVKISNFLMLMNHSTGKERISERSRSSALVVFRVNPVHTLTLATTPSTDHSDNHSQYSKRSNGSSNHSAPYDYSSNSHSDSHFSPQKQSTSSSRHNTFSGGSDKKIDMQLLSPTKLVYPTTKPYFDPKTQSIVQGRRKKHVSELRGMISGDDLR